jgi:beta-lactamase class A
MRLLWLSALIYVCALALISISANAAENGPADQIRAIENKSGGTIGIVAVNTKSKQRIEYRPNERFPMCSTFKLLAVGAVLQRVDQGKEKLDRFVAYTDKDILEYAPVTKEQLSEGGMTLGALCQAAIEQSDNTAGNLILQTIGGPKGVTQFARSIGDNITRLDRMEPELNEVGPNDGCDTTTPAAMCADMQRLIGSDLLSMESRSRLNNWLEHSETGTAMIRTGTPVGWRVGDKTGRSRGGVTNDVAVIYPPDGTPIFVVIYSFGLRGSDVERSAALASAGRIVISALHQG